MYQPNHIDPDDKHIDRLFPKCKPNYNQRQLQTQRRKTRSRKHYRRAKPKSIQIGNLASKNSVNDTSSEELCSNNHISNELEQQSTIIFRGVESLLKPTPALATQQADNSNDTNEQLAQRLVDVSSTSSPIDSVKSSELSQINENLKLVDHHQSPPMATQQQHFETSQTSENLPTAVNQTNLSIRRNLTPPGFAQRIQQCSLPDMKEDRLIRPIVQELPPQPKLEQAPSVIAEITTAVRSSRLSQEAAGLSSVGRTEGQRVKFNDEELVSFQGEPATGLRLNDKSSTATNFTSIRREHSPLMPIIKEDQNEAELEDARQQLTEQQQQETSQERCLPSDQAANGRSEKPSTNSILGSEPPLEPELLSDLTQRDLPSSPQTVDHDSPSEQAPQSMKQSPEIELRVEETIDCQQLNLRHHRLPNETSHYSMTRITREDPPPKEEETTPRFSSLQFNTLSEVESDAEESQIPLTNRSASKPVAAEELNPTQQSDNHAVQTSDPLQISRPTSSGRLLMNANTNLPTTRLTNGSSRELQQQQTGSLTITTKTTTSQPKQHRAIIFPCLDDGLSSEPDSCEDDVEDDYERAMDADIEADDDDDDDGIDEDVENTLNSLSRLAMVQQANNTYNSSHSQQRQRQTHRGSSASSRQRSENQFGVDLVSDQSGPNQMKNLGLAYYSPNQETAFEMKSSAGQSGHWVNSSSSSGTGPRNSSSQQAFGGPGGGLRSNLNSNDTRLSLDTKDEVKLASRLSSDTDNETDRLLGSQRGDQQLKQQTSNDFSSKNAIDSQPTSSPMKQQSSNSKEVLIEGVLFNVKYLGSTHNECEGRSEKEDRILQAEMAVKEVKFRNGVTQSAVEVQLFISTEKIMVLDDKHRKIMMDHSLRTISYIADIGDAFVLIVRKKGSNNNSNNNNNSEPANEPSGRTLPKISCHVFESSESHTITKSISQAFQVAYAELIKANGSSGDGSGSYLPRELDYQEVLNSQEMSTDEIEMFARKENQREVIVPKNENEILGISIVESGWGSMLPTVVIASLKHDGPAYRCKKLSIGDVILSVNGISMVGLSLGECQKILGKTKSQRVAQLTIVPCPITVEVKIKRPDTKYQLGFSVQNGVICSLLRGGIAERGGVRVGHRIMSINGTTVVGVPHEKIVTLLASSVGEIRMKTCLTSIYRHMTGEENPVHL